MALQIKFRLRFAVFLLLVVISCSSCFHFTDCGTFTFTPSTPEPNPPTLFGPTAVPLLVQFNPDNSKCKPSVAACQCNSIVFIQLIRISDPNNTNPNNISQPTYKDRFSIFPGPEYFPRQTKDGWSVDVSSSRPYGYYGLDENLMPITTAAGVQLAVIGRTGANALAASIHDKPSFSRTVQGANVGGAQPHGTLMEAIDVPVCINGDQVCTNKILGYLYWRIYADANNNIIDVTAQFNDDDYSIVVRDAIDAWNAHLNDGGFKRIAFPNFTLMR